MTTAKGQSVRLMSVHGAGPADVPLLIHPLLYQKLKSKNNRPVSNQKPEFFKTPSRQVHSRHLYTVSLGLLHIYNFKR